MNCDLAAEFWLHSLKNVTFQPKAVVLAYQIAKHIHTHTLLFYDYDLGALFMFITECSI